MPFLVTLMPALSPSRKRLSSSSAMPTWNAPTLAVTALIAFYVFNGVRGALGDDSILPDAVKPAKLGNKYHGFVQAYGFHMLISACFMTGVIVNDIAHVMMPTFVAVMLVEVFKHFVIHNLPGAAPAVAFALVFACLARGAPARKPMKWNLATTFFAAFGLIALLVGSGMLLGDDSIIPEQMKPLDSLSQLKLIGSLELRLSTLIFGSTLAGSAQAMQPFWGLALLVAVVLHVVIGDIEGCPMIVGLATAHLCLGLFWKGKDEAKAE